MRYAHLFFLPILATSVSVNATDLYTLSLKGDTIGELPKGWIAAKTGVGPGSVWKVVEDSTARGGKVIAQTSAEGPNPLFNLCVAEDTSFADIDLTVAFKAAAGKLDQGGGPVWRYQDANNYYIARMNPLEDNFRVFKVVGGKRTQLDSAEVKLSAGVWHRIRIVQLGDGIRCYLNGKFMLEARDRTFAGAGKIGLWTKADAVTHFDDLRVKQPSDEIVSEKVTVPKEYPGLRHVLEAADGIYSGSEPEGDEGFESLCKLGIKTIVSVDGISPNVEKAKKNGLQYIHIPFGYDGIPVQAGAALANVMRQQSGPIYVHCHHGIHRGPAAASVLCIASGKADHEQALAFLAKAGTSKDYAGLWRDVGKYEPPAKDADLPELKESATVSSLASKMAEIDRIIDRLKQCQDASWGSPRPHSDLVPSHEAAMLHDYFRQVRESHPNRNEELFRRTLSGATELAGQLETSLDSNQKEQATRHFTALKQSCIQCHKACRD